MMVDSQMRWTERLVGESIERSQADGWRLTMVDHGNTESSTTLL
jgi:hypothetical protein